MEKKLAIALTSALIAVAGWAAPASAQTFVAHLSGDAEVPPVETMAVGQATVIVTPNGVLHGVSVGNIDGILAAHIHCAPEGLNGPVGITVFNGALAGSGNLARGMLPEPDPGNVCEWASLDDAIAAMLAGDAYVNVHTLRSLGGEIRGQLR